MELRTGQRPKHIQDSQSPNGFSLLETMLGMVLFAIVLGSMLSVLEVGRKTRSNTLERGEDTQDVRIALNQMSTDVLNSGVDYPNVGPELPTNWLYNHLGLAPSSPTSALDNLTPVIPGYNGSLAFTGTDYPDSRLTNTTVSPSTTTTTDQVTLVSANYLFNSGNAVTLVPQSVSTSNKTATLLVSSPANNGSSSSPTCNIGDIYFIWWAAQPNGIIGIVTSLATTNSSNDSVVLAASGDPLGLNSFLSNTVDVGALAGVSTASAYKLDFVTYFLKDDGTGRGTGTVTRRVYGGASSGTASKYTDEPIAFNVSAMSIYYTMSDSSSTENPSLSQYQSIRQIKVSITVQSPSRVQLANNAAAGSTTTYIPETLTSIMNTRNLGYEKN